MVKDFNVECVIYCATFPNGKKYIGQTKRRFVDRYKEHKYASSLDEINLCPFYRAIKKYGFENLDWSILEICESEEYLNDREVYWINEYNSFIGFKGSMGYNGTVGGAHKTNILVKKAEVFYTKSLYWKERNIEDVIRETGLSEHDIRAILRINNKPDKIKKNLVYKIKNLLADGRKPEDIAVKYNVSCRSVIDILFLNRYKEICKHLNDKIAEEYVNYKETYDISQIIQAKIDLAKGKSLGEVAYYNQMKFYAVKDLQRLRTYRDVMENLNESINSHKQGYVKIINN